MAEGLLISVITPSQVNKSEQRFKFCRQHALCGILCSNLSFARVPAGLFVGPAWSTTNNGHGGTAPGKTSTESTPPTHLLPAFASQARICLSKKTQPPPLASPLAHQTPLLFLESSGTWAPPFLDSHLEVFLSFRLQRFILAPCLSQKSSACAICLHGSQPLWARDLSKLPGKLPKLQNKRLLSLNPLALFFWILKTFLCKGKEAPS